MGSPQFVIQTLDYGDILAPFAHHTGPSSINSGFLIIPADDNTGSHHCSSVAPLSNTVYRATFSQSPIPMSAYHNTIAQRWCIAAAAFRASLDRSPFTYDAWVGVEPDSAHREKE